ncbi:CPBP family intramembrane metalloprotease [Bacillus cereus]|uniref:type II CAAX endopeptidase family protein n=1 Tax=Bacillus cereus group TaxID=86661 RepID=UPI000BEDA90E|nr:type II CAAX endopeptidase family protein [Bacillus cereus]PDZ04631.1 CPBP family intramembrane metalloprotease [Bacillus cereus]PEC55518.1 CPBP family intramembrane metalloprotease [Bacillus cereus]PFE50613.1 CPBP family intramembrane metalloprotease [Bacillus cereus]PFN15813.1 CPBP family intramembrane metalloprotease [Bacillus cereus]PFS83290.1 CPBP family intramembrane metalloprotease [Bacillus cereus]
MDTIFGHMKTRFILIWAIISFVIMMFILPLLFKEMPKDVKLNIALIISIYAIPMFWIALKFKRYNISFKTYLSKPSSFSFRTIFASAIMTMLFGLGMLLLIVMVFSLLPTDTSLGDTNEIVKTQSMWFVLMKAITLSFIAPICEEILFRGFILSRFTYKFGIKKAVIFSSICFGVLHLNNVFGTTIFGIISCLMYLKTKSLFPSIIAHMVNNIIVATRDIFSALQSTNTPAAQPEITIILLIAIVLMTIGLMWIIPFIKKHSELLRYDSLPPLKHTTT